MKLEVSHAATPPLDDLSLHSIVPESQSDELYRVRRALEASRAHCQTLYELSSLGYCTLNESGVIVEANLIVAALLSEDSRALLNQPLSRFVAQSDTDNFNFLCEQVIRTGGRRMCELRMKKSDGEQLWMHLAVTAAREMSGVLVLHVALNDITGRKCLEQKLVEVSEGYQRTLGQELHDHLGQQIAAIGYQARALEKMTADNPVAAKLAASIASQAHGAVTQCKQMAQGLLPFELEAHGLYGALKLFVSGVNERYGLDCSLECSDELVMRDPHLALNLYRIVQEAVNNAVRHSGASHLRVTLAQDGGCLILAVCDDGCGFEYRAGAFAGLGLKIMQYRAMQFGASLQFLPRAGGGTEVRLKLRLS